MKSPLKSPRILISLIFAFSFTNLANAKDVDLLNVSYDPTRELYEQYNKLFSDYWQKKTGDDVTVKQSHGGSGKQAQAVINGQDADVVTLALAYDIDAISQKSGKLPANWQTLLPDNSAPYTSTIVFLVRKGNPKAIKDWDDLTKPGVTVVVANPKTSGGARWAYLAAYGYELEKTGHDDAAALKFIKAVYRNAPVLDSGSRGSTLTFAQRNVGDVLLAFENEAHLAQKEFGDQGFEIVTPSISILAEPSVAVVTKNAEKHGTSEAAKGYLEYLYSPEAQELEAKNYYRPRDKAVSAKYASNFANVKLFTIDEEFGGWTKAQKRHFSDGGVFDQLYNNL